MRERFVVRVIHTIASTRLDHGGTSRSVPALVDALAKAGVDVHLVAGRPADAGVPCGWPADASRVHAVTESPRMRAWGIGRKMRRELAALCEHDGPTLIHDHGLWLATNHAAAAFARKRGLVRVVSPRGMLAEWSLGHGRLKKLAAWRAYQRRDLETATAFHATSEAEAQDIRRLGLGQTIAIVPNGMAFPPLAEQRPWPEGRRTMLFLSRIHPKKGLVNLLRAWRAAAPGPAWRLVIAGPDEGGHAAEVKRTASELGLAQQVEFPGEIVDGEKWAWYAAAEAFVLPSFNENFGLAVAEALGVGTPVLTTTGTPWEELEGIGAGWRVAPTVEGLEAGLRSACGAPRSTLRAMGQAGQAWAREAFAWPGIARRMLAAYEAVLRGTRTSDFID